MTRDVLINRRRFLQSLAAVGVAVCQFLDGGVAHRA